MIVKYVHEFIHGKKEKKRTPLATYEEREISPVVMEILRNDEAFGNSRVFGDPRLGEPLEYEKLVVVDEDGERTLEYFNKGIHYMTQSGEPARRIFQVFTFFMGKLLDKKKELAAQPRVPAEPDDEQEIFLDFSEDEISIVPEWEAKGKLLMELLRFGQSLIKDKLEAPNGGGHPQFAEIFASAPAGTQHLLYSAFTEWLILDHPTDERRNKVADLYHMRKKTAHEGPAEEDTANLARNGNGPVRGADSSSREGYGPAAPGWRRDGECYRDHGQPATEALVVRSLPSLAT